MHYHNAGFPPSKATPAGPKPGWVSEELERTYREKLQVIHQITSRFKAQNRVLPNEALEQIHRLSTIA
jgi:hypothetical protein